MKIITAVVAFLATGYFFIRIFNFDYEEAFSDIDGVVAVEDYLDYENRRFVTLQIEGGGVLKIGGFDRSIFSGTDFVSLRQIGDNTTICRRISSGTTLGNVFNVIEFVGSRNSIQLDDISDIVDNYNLIESVIAQEVPDKESEAREFRLRNSAGTYREAKCHLRKAESS